MRIIAAFLIACLAMPSLAADLDVGVWPARVGYVDPVYEVKKVFFATDPTVTHELTAFGTDQANSDEVLTLGTGEDAPEFAWVTIDSVTLPTSSVWLDASNRYGFDYFRTTTGDFNLTDSDYPRVGLLYVDWADHIPEGATILEATYHYLGYNTTYTAWDDTLVATLMTNEADNLWYAQKGVAFSSDSAANMAYSNWSHQVAPLDASGYPATGSAWDPALETRLGFEEWGDYFDWTGFDPQSPVTLTEIPIDIKNCVQAAVNGATNNGIMMYAKRGGEERSWLKCIIEPRPAHAFWAYIPWITVTYSVRPYSQPFPGGDFCFVFTTDDGLIDANEAYSDVFDEFDWNYTAFYSKVHFTGAANYPTIESMMGIYEAGNEVGCHSRYHLSPDGIATWDAWTMVNAGWDSLLFDTEPAWMHNFSELYDGSRREAAPYFAKSFATPQNKLTQPGLFALVSHGYNGVRYGRQSTQSAGGYDLMDLRADESDSLRVTGEPGTQSEPYRMLRPRNMMGVPTSIGIESIVGAKENTTITEAEVKWNARRFFAQALANKTKVVSMYCHTLKSNPSYDGMDGEELRWILEVVQEMYGTCMRFSDYTAWGKAFSTPIATPAAYAIIDSFKFEASDEVWFEPIPESRLYPFEEE